LGALPRNESCGVGVLRYYGTFIKRARFITVNKWDGAAVLLIVSDYQPSATSSESRFPSENMPREMSSQDAIGNSCRGKRYARGSAINPPVTFRVNLTPFNV